MCILAVCKSVASSPATLLLFRFSPFSPWFWQLLLRPCPRLSGVFQFVLQLLLPDFIEQSAQFRPGPHAHFDQVVPLQEWWADLRLFFQLNRLFNQEIINIQKPV